MHQTNINYAILFNSHLQLTAYTTYRGLLKTINLMVRHLTRPRFQESCWYEVLLWRCYVTEEASQFRNKAQKPCQQKKIL